MEKTYLGQGYLNLGDGYVPNFEKHNDYDFKLVPPEPLKGNPGQLELDLESDETSKIKNKDQLSFNF